MFVLPCIIYVPYALFFIESIDTRGSGSIGGDDNRAVDGENDRTRKSSNSKTNINIGMYSLETLRKMSLKCKRLGGGGVCFLSGQSLNAFCVVTAPFVVHENIHDLNIFSGWLSVNRFSRFQKREKKSKENPMHWTWKHIARAQPSHLSVCQISKQKKICQSVDGHFTHRFEIISISLYLLHSCSIESNWFIRTVKVFIFINFIVWLLVSYCTRPFCPNMLHIHQFDDIEYDICLVCRLKKHD